MIKVMIISVCSVCVSLCRRYIAEFGPLNEAVTLNGATLVKVGDTGH